ncbi:MAG TPA: DUF1573 domain-containing protein [Agriterribacter sp.]|nr:DUF1573 domain-containing protein [Agriterribacter sp.]HRQ51425.1 DUF1573 domain-containing protein [Agriterribacter sp.]
MQKLYTLLFILSLAAVVQAQNDTSQATAKDVLLLKETRYDFGKIQQGKPVTHIFEVVNTGKEPLQIENVQASCGCTTPEWSHDPIAPGTTKKITVGYNAAAKGKFEKAITIFYNAGKTKLLYIKGEVWETPADPAPANASVQLLKNINH